MNIVDILISLLYFIVFVAAMFFVVRRYLPVLQQADEEERKQYKQLVGYRAGLKKQLDKEHVALKQQDFVYEYICRNAERWKIAFQQQQEKDAQERILRQQKMVRNYEHQLQVVSERQLEKKVMPEIFAQARKELYEQFQGQTDAAQKAGHAYIVRSLDDLQHEAQS